MNRLFKAIDAVSEWSGKLFAYLLWPGVVVLVYEIFLRHLFDAPTIWAHGTTQRIFAAYYFIGGAYVLLHKSHINMDVIYNRFSLRTRAILDVVGTSLFLAFCGVLLWWGSGYAWESLMRLEPCGTPFRAPLYPVKLMIPLGALLILLQGLSKFGHDLFTAITGREYEH